MDKSKDKLPPPVNLATAAKPKEKRRSNEKRKEKSRDAARCRRSRETEIFTELGQVLPLQREEVEQLDKASIMRLSIAFLKIRETLKLFPKIENLSLLPSEDEKIEELDKKPFDLLNGKEAYECMSLALDGFLILLSSDGDVTYVSENISEYLGISQIDILGQQIWEYTHQCDHDELKEALNVRRNGKAGDDKKENSLNGSDSALTTVHRDFFLRLKCTLTSRGRSVNIKSASYKVIHITGHMVMNNEGDRILIAVGRPLPHPSNIEIPLGTTSFLTKHSLDMKFTYVDDKMSLLGYQPEDLFGKSLYDCHHGADSESLMTTFKSVLSKGQCETARYRFLGKLGGYSWVVTQATIVYDKQKPQSVVCVNYAISEIENNNEIYSCAQLEAYRQNQEIITVKDDHQKSDKQQQKQQQILPKQQQQQQSEKLNDDENSNDCLINNNIKINNNNKNDQIKCDLIQVKRNCNSVGVIVEPIKQPQQLQLNKKRDETPLSPIRRTFNNCSISSTPTITTSSSSTVIKSQEIRPKSVTASVFTQVPISSDYLQNLNHQITTQSSSLSSSLSTTGTILKAQSVTASVLTPISSLSTPINRSFLSANLTKFLPRNCSGSTANTSASSAAPAATEDMNKGYLMFAEESHDLTMLKEEPDDLTHLAPTAGDACIPLDESTPLFGEMLESLILPDAYGTLLSDDINSLDSQQSNCNNNTNNNKNHHIDPFINYRDESSDTSHSPHLLSPGSASKSPEMSSLPSLCSPNSLSQDDEFAFMTMNVEDDIDLTMRAPYIPMNEQEDLPLLTDDLMWSAFSEELSLHKDIKEALQMEAMKNHHNNALNNNSLNSSNSNVTNNTTNVTNEHHGNNNSNNSESSLAALLCGNSIQQDDNSTILNDSSDSKKRKILLSNDNTANNLVDNIDAFGPVFSKNLTNVDCWTMSDLLQINTTTNNASSIHQENRPEKQNIIVNTAIPTTIHVPLIAIQNKNNCNAKLSCSSILTTNNNNNNTNMTTTTATINTTTTQNHNSLGNNNNNNTSTMKKLSTKTIHVVPIISNKSNSLASNKIANNLNSGTIITTSSSSSQCSSKRPSNIILTSETKRVKNSPMIEIPTSPQLLQQLMAPTPQRQRTKSPYDKIQTGRWIGDNGDGQQSTNLSPSSQSPSNSVLKNLLVSGCDDTFPPQPPDIILDEVQLQRSLQGSPNQQSFYIAPLTCTTSTTDQIMRHCSTNPLIGGVGILPSPTIVIDGGDEVAECAKSLVPVVADALSPSGFDSSTSDSGIESSPNSIINPERNTSGFLNGRTTGSFLDGGGGLSKMEVTLPGDGILKMPIDSGGRKTEESRKMSFSFLDDGNLLCSPYLMDLCSDDYSMDEPLDNGFLQESEITKVLSEWTNDVTT